MLTMLTMLTMVRAVAMLEPGALTVPLGVNGKPSFRRGAICRANGIAPSAEEAHDAMVDTKATLALLRHLRDVAPTAVAPLLGLADKGVPHRMQASGEVLLLGGSARLTPVSASRRDQRSRRPERWPISRSIRRSISIVRPMRWSRCFRSEAKDRSGRSRPTLSRSWWLTSTSMLIRRSA